MTGVIGVLPAIALLRARTHALPTLFMSVALSMVIFLPMLQLGWVMAWSTVTSASFSTGQSRKAPPDAVRMIL